YKGAQLGDLEHPDQDFGGTESSAVPGEKLTKNTYTGEPISKDAYLAAIRGGDGALVKQEKDARGENVYRGNMVQQYQHHDFTNPLTQQTLADIQTQDAITGQQDRHGGNLVIDPASGRAHGYDNDRIDLRQVSGVAFGNLRKPAAKPMSILDKLFHRKELQEQRKAELAAHAPKRRAARIRALKQVDDPRDKNLGLPSHMSERTASSLIGLKSKDFIQQMIESDPKNIERMTIKEVEDLRNRYSAVRRYAKAGAAAAAMQAQTNGQPSNLITAAQAAKWGSADYQGMVKQGTGDMLPRLVTEGGWGAQTYNEQMAAPTRRLFNGQNTIGKEGGQALAARGYLQRSVKAYNYARSGAGQGVLGVSNPESDLPTHIDMEGGLAAAAAPSTAASELNLPPKPTMPAPRPNTPLPTEPMVLASSEPDHKRSEVVGRGGELPRQVSAAIQKQRGGGVTLPETIQTEARNILGHDFSDVRIHTGPEAQRLSRSIQAKAFAIGKDIFFKQGVYAPGSISGRETLLHELTHVAQQTGSRNNAPLRLGAPDTAHEKQAEQISKDHSTPSAPGSGQAGVVQRSTLKE
ncbi:MAG: DUF4157 domain-containing protein, partial [Chloroflexota bacterium]